MSKGKKIVLPWEETSLLEPFSSLMLDGGWGSEFIRREGFHHQCFESYNITHPERVREIAGSFVAAGCELLLTNTFQGSALVLQQYNFGKQWKDINQAGVLISQEMAEKKARVFASMGPVLRGISLENIGHQKLAQTFREQAKVLADAGAEGIVLETFTMAEEAKIAVEAVLSVVEIPVGISGSFGFGIDGLDSAQGWNIKSFVQQFASYPLKFWGINCGKGFEASLPLLDYFIPFAKPIWFKPNMGVPKMVNGVAEYLENPTDFPWERFKLNLRNHVAFLGGCCGTTPEHLIWLKDSLVKW